MDKICEILPEVETKHIYNRDMNVSGVYNLGNKLKNMF